MRRCAFSSYTKDTSLDGFCLIDFAGASSIFSQTCSGTCYTDYVMGNGSNYATAYFDISYVKVFGTPGNNTVVSGGNSSSSGSDSSGGDNSAMTLVGSPVTLLSTIIAGVGAVSGFFAM